MIMNPHAIPSRMTIAQNLEQLLGKTAALTGGIGDGTAFMNDGSPQEDIGALLGKFGFEKYGNEVMYNGATGEQIKAAIFIGPVYGMRLKHMVEDKWQARGQGRREQRTHQPTGGRGSQGGLKIGEMDRDAILGHGVAGFFKESFMERSDGTTMPICTSCGMIPIYNPRIGLKMCQMCDGPIRFIGDNINNLEVLPPLGRPKSNIVEVQVPYANKVLGQELETYLNIAMRYMTTAGIQKLKELEFSGKSTEVIKELPKLILPETQVPEYSEQSAKNTVTLEQQIALGAYIQQLSEAEKKEIDTVLEETPQGESFSENIQIAELTQQTVPIQTEQQGYNPFNNIEGETQNQVIQNPFNSIQSPLQQNVISEQTGGLLPPENEMVLGAGIPNGPPTLIVSTDAESMMRDGIDINMSMGGRPLRRSSFRNGFGGQMMPQRNRFSQGYGSNTNDLESNNKGISNSASVTVNKLE
jgi:hypothetical protein